MATLRAGHEDLQRKFTALFSNKHACLVNMEFIQQTKQVHNSFLTQLFKTSMITTKALTLALKSKKNKIMNIG